MFYSDSGSTAVEVALKMAFQYWQQAADRRPSRTSFVCLENAYHGDTVGSVSVGGIDLFHSMYEPLLFDSHRVPAGDAAALESVLSAQAGEIAAVVVEPLVQGAAGMLLQPPGYLRAVRDLCDRHDVFLVCDEVATGFGRTGTMFACEQEDVAPDFLCLAKGLTGGYLPLAATLTTDRVHDGFLGEHEEFRTFFHGHTYTGNPLACAAALADARRVRAGAHARAAGAEDGAAGAAPARPRRAAAPRGRGSPLGFMCGIELADRDGRPYDPALRMGHR